MADRDRSGLTAVGADSHAAPDADERSFSAREGRRFAFPVGLAFLALAAVFWWREHTPIAAGLGSLAAALFVAGLLVPSRLGPVSRGWMALARAISKITTPVVMAILYFLVLTPAGWLRRHLGGHPLRARDDDGSYWVQKEDGPGDLERQF